MLLPVHSLSSRERRTRLVQEVKQPQWEQEREVKLPHKPPLLPAVSFVPEDNLADGFIGWCR
jgi:hypothetical protein